MVNLIPVLGSDGEPRLVNQMSIPDGSLVGGTNRAFTLKDNVATEVRAAVDSHTPVSEIEARASSEQ